MPSDQYRRHLAPEDLQMLERVLHRAGYGVSDLPADKDRFQAAARFLIRKFQDGHCSEGALLAALSRKFGCLETPRQVGPGPVETSIAGSFRFAALS